MIKARYTGNGEFYEGIPARDLTDVEYAALTDEQRRLVDSGKLYERVPEKRAPKED